MLKIILLDIKIFNHIFDIFNGGKGIFEDFEENNSGKPKKERWTKRKKSQGMG
jgi:hypothetical protein